MTVACIPDDGEAGACLLPAAGPCITTGCDPSSQLEIPLHFYINKFKMIGHLFPLLKVIKEVEVVHHQRAPTVLELVQALTKPFYEPENS